jgi:hypothetical protein
VQIYVPTRLFAHEDWTILGGDQGDLKIGSFEFGFVVCTHSPSLCALKFSLTFWVLSESKKHADPSTENQSQ